MGCARFRHLVRSCHSRGTELDSWLELMEPLLAGLPLADQQTLLQRLDQARGEQLDRKRHPPARHRPAGRDRVGRDGAGRP